MQRILSILRPLQKFIPLLKLPFLTIFFSIFLAYSTRSMSRNNDQTFSKIINFFIASNLRKGLILVCLIMASCSPNSFEDFQTEGEALSRSIISDLQRVQTTQQLVEFAPVLKKRFYSLVELMIQARKYQEAHPEEWTGEKPATEGTFNELMIIEIARVHKIERGREIIEKTQRDALHRLDAFERDLKKRREKLLKETLNNCFS